MKAAVYNIDFCPNVPTISGHLSLLKNSGVLRAEMEKYLLPPVAPLFGRAHTLLVGDVNKL